MRLEGRVAGPWASELDRVRPEPPGVRAVGELDARRRGERVGDCRQHVHVERLLERERPAALRQQSKKLVIDLHNVTYADASGKKVLRDIYAQTRAELVATTPWTQFLAEEVTANKVVAVEEGE